MTVRSSSFVGGLPRAQKVLAIKRVKGAAVFGQMTVVYKGRDEFFYSTITDATVLREAAE